MTKRNPDRLTNLAEKQIWTRVSRATFDWLSRYAKKLDANKADAVRAILDDKRRVVGELDK